MGFIPEFRERSFLNTSNTIDVNEAPRMANAVTQTVNQVANAAINIDQAAQKRKLITDQQSLIKQDSDEKLREQQEYRALSEEIEKDPSKADELSNKFIEDRSVAYDLTEMTLDTPEGKQAASQLKAQRIEKLKLSVDNLKHQKIKEKALSDSQAVYENWSLIATENSTLPKALEALESLDANKFTTSNALGENAANELDNKGRKNVVSTFIDSNLVQGNTSAAKEFLKDEKIKEALGAKGVLNARSKIKSIEEQRKRRAEGLKQKLAKDPWGKWDYIGGKSAPLNLQAFNPEADPDGVLITQTLMQRQLTVESAKQEGIDLPFFRKTESEAFVKAFSSGRPENVGQIFSHLDRYTDDVQKKQLAKQLFFDEKQPALAGALSIADAEPETASLILQGKNLMQNDLEGVLGKSMITSPSDSTVNEEFDLYIKNALPDPSARSIAREAAFYHYSALKAKSGSFSKDLDVGAFRDSINAVIGEPLNINDSYIPSFRARVGDEYRMLDENDFERLLDNASEENLFHSQGSFPITTSGDAINMENSRYRVNFKASKNGKYFLYRDQEPLMDSKTFQPYQIDLKSLSEFIQDPVEKTQMSEQERQMIKRGREKFNIQTPSLDEFRTGSSGFR